MIYLTENIYFLSGWVGGGGVLRLYATKTRGRVQYIPYINRHPTSPWPLSDLGGNSSYAYFAVLDLKCPNTEPLL